MTERLGPSDYLDAEDAPGAEEASRQLQAEHHALWLDSLITPARQHGLVAGARVLEVGCGDGHLLAELSRWVGPSGWVVGIDRDPAAVLQSRRALGGRPQAGVIEGDLYRTRLGGPWDLVLARGVMAELPTPELGLQRLIGGLARGGRLILQDQLHEGMRVFPDEPAVDRAVAALRTLERSRRRDLFAGGRLPGLAAAAGLVVEVVAPRQLSGGPGTAVWAQVGRLLVGQAAQLQPLLSASEWAELVEAWAWLGRSPTARVFTPIQVLTIARRP